MIRGKPDRRWVKVNGSAQRCWLINLSRDKDGKCIFPFGEDFEQLLHPNEADKKNVDQINDDLAGSGKSVH
jgi:hypothetical protein